MSNSIPISKAFNKEATLNFKADQEEKDYIVQASKDMKFTSYGQLVRVAVRLFLRDWYYAYDKDKYPIKPGKNFKDVEEYIVWCLKKLEGN